MFSKVAIFALAQAVVTDALVTGLRGGANTTAQNKAPCQCKSSDPSWVKASRTENKCVFIDLGAANGNSFDAFLKNSYGPVANCPGGRWEAVLVEANPRFNKDLANVVAQQKGRVTAMASTAAFMCEATTSFFLDTKDVAENYWGSSLSSNHPDVKKSGMQKVTVPMMNINKVLYERTIPGDWVMLKMDIEGAEYDILPCLVNSPEATLIDRIFMEVHDPSWSLTGTSAAAFEAAKAALKVKGVDIPPYFSPTL